MVDHLGSAFQWARWLWGPAGACTGIEGAAAGIMIRNFKVDSEGPKLQSHGFDPGRRVSLGDCRARFGRKRPRARARRPGPGTQKLPGPKCFPILCLTLGGWAAAALGTSEVPLLVGRQRAAFEFCN